MNNLFKLLYVLKGGSGSGDFGHYGRDQRGGSSKVPHSANEAEFLNAINPRIKVNTPTGDIRDKLLGPMTNVVKLGGGVNRVVVGDVNGLAVIEKDFKKIFRDKVEGEERPSYKAKHLADANIAAGELDRDFGYNLVPPVVKSAPMKVRLLFLHGLKIWGEYDGMEKIESLNTIPPVFKTPQIIHDLQRAALEDALSGQLDRHNNNFGVLNGRLVLHDNDYAFPLNTSDKFDAPAGVYTAWKDDMYGVFSGKAMAPDIYNDLKGFVQRYDKEDGAAKYGDMVSPYRATLMREQAEYMLKTGTYPKIKVVE